MAKQKKKSVHLHMNLGTFFISHYCDLSDGIHIELSWKKQTGNL